MLGAVQYADDINDYLRPHQPRDFRLSREQALINTSLVGEWLRYTAYYVGDTPSMAKWEAFAEQKLAMAIIQDSVDAPQYYNPAIATMSMDELTRFIQRFNMPRTTHGLNQRPIHPAAKQALARIWQANQPERIPMEPNQDDDWMWS